jgi:hypothetical protein
MEASLRVMHRLTRSVRPTRPTFRPPKRGIYVAKNRVSRQKVANLGVPTSNIQHPTSNIQPPVPSLRLPIFDTLTPSKGLLARERSAYALAPGSENRGRCRDFCPPSGKMQRTKVIGLLSGGQLAEPRNLPAPPRSPADESPDFCPLKRVSRAGQKGKTFPVAQWLSGSVALRHSGAIKFEPRDCRPLCGRAAGLRER